MHRIIVMAGFALAALATPASAQMAVPTVSNSVTITWEEPKVADISISPAELPGGNAELPYPAVQFVANGGTGPYQFKAIGNLPKGLSLDLTGLLRGLPVRGGAYAFTVTALDSKQNEGTRNYSITISGDAEPCPPGQVRFGANCVNSGTAQPPVAPVTPVVPQTVDLSIPMQQALRDIGCYLGAVDGNFGPGSRTALTKFVSLTGLRLDRVNPTQAALNAARTKGPGFCPAPPPPPKPPVVTSGGGGGSCGFAGFRDKRTGQCACKNPYRWNGSKCVEDSGGGGGSGGGEEVVNFLCTLAQAACNGQWIASTCTCKPYPQQQQPAPEPELPPHGGGDEQPGQQCVRECSDCPCQ